MAEITWGSLWWRVKLLVRIRLNDARRWVMKRQRARYLGKLWRGPARWKRKEIRSSAGASIVAAMDKMALEDRYAVGLCVTTATRRRLLEEMRDVLRYPVPDAQQGESFRGVPMVCGEVDGGDFELIGRDGSRQVFQAPEVVRHEWRLVGPFVTHANLPIVTDAEVARTLKNLYQQQSGMSGLLSRGLLGSAMGSAVQMRIAQEERRQELARKQQEAMDRLRFQQWTDMY